MGRQEQPIQPGPLHDFAQGLRLLRTQAGEPSYRALSRKAGYSASALSAAAAGQMLPSLAVTQAYVGACGGDPREWEHRWRLLAAQLRRTDPGLLTLSPSAAADESPVGASGGDPPGTAAGTASPQQPAADGSMDAAPATPTPATSSRPRTVVRFGMGPLLLVAGIITALIIANANGSNTISAVPPAIISSGTAAAPPSPSFPSMPAPSGSPISGRAPAYRLVYGDRVLATKDYNSSIDLTTGRVVGESGRWLLGTNSGGDGKGAFELQDATDAVIVGRQKPTAAQCATAVTQRPLHDLLHFAQAGAGTWFCLRWQLTGDIATVQTLDVDTGEYGVGVTVSYYRPPG